MNAGAGLFSNDNQLLGIAVHLTSANFAYTICALLYNDKKFITDFVNDVPQARE